MPTTKPPPAGLLDSALGSRPANAGAGSGQASAAMAEAAGAAVVGAVVAAGALARDRGGEGAQALALATQARATIDTAEIKSFFSDAESDGNSDANNLTGLNCSAIDSGNEASSGHGVDAGLDTSAGVNTTVRSDYSRQYIANCPEMALLSPR